MTVAEATLRHYMQQADRMARVEASMPQVYGGDVAIAGLRAFIRYHKDATQDVMVGGRLRSLTHKQVAMHGLVARLAVTGERTTMTAMAKEAHVATSTVSRYLDKLQAWKAYAVDVIRGRNGGVRVRPFLDSLIAYAERAWSRVRRAAERALSRTKLNVASTSQGLDSSTSQGTWKVPVPMDATFSENCDGSCTGLLDCSTLDRSPLAHSRTSRDADLLYVRAQEFARQVIEERRRLDRDDPDWDLYLENVRSSYGLG